MKGGNKMLKKTVLATAIAGIVLLGTSAFARVDLHEGLWEITTKMEMPGMPMQMPARKHTQCLTKKNLLETMVPKEQTQEEECKIIDQKISGNTVTWTMKCSGKDAMEATGKNTYHGDTFEGTITMISNDPDDGKMKIINHISGKRIGECK
jgi:Protein of unknown function (DUF3617)